MPKKPYILFMRHYPNDVIVTTNDYTVSEKRMLTRKRFESKTDAWEYLFENFDFEPKDVGFLSKFDDDLDLSRKLREELYGRLKK